MSAWHCFAFAFYAVMAAGVIDHGKSLTRDIAGQGSDPFAFIWFLAWWPWAIGHHIDPLFTRLVWQPAGVYLDWVTSVPLLGLVGWPLTLVSPVLTYNFFVLLGPVLAAFVAYLLCRYLTRMPVAAVIGGFLFGYSSYEMAQDTATLNLSFTAFVPALLLVVLLRLDDRLSRLGVVLLAGLALVCQFLISIEIFGMIFVFGGLGWALALVYLPQRRAVLRRLAVDGMTTAPLVLAVLSPVLISMARHAGTIALPAAWPYFFTTDLLNFVVPTRANLFGGGAFSGIFNHFNGGVQEQDGYLGLPLLLIIGLFIRERSAEPACRLLFLMFVILMLLSLGPRLWVDGHYTGIALPWTLFVHLPLLRSALPARFNLFTSLCAGLMASLWISRPDAGQYRLRVALGGVACLALWPSLHPWMAVPDSAFFQPGRVETALGRDARVLVLPFAINGPSSLWQADTHFAFAQTGGYLGFPPKPMQGFAVVSQLFGGFENPGFPTDLAQFCAATDTQFIVAGPGTPDRLKAEIGRLHWQTRTIDDVAVITVPGAEHPSHG